MTKQNSISSWEAHFLRATIFLRQAYPKIDIWHELTGENPESDDNRPREGQRIQIGSWKEASVEVQMSASRIDIFLTPIISPSSKYTLGAVDEQMKLFAGLIGPWLSKAELQCARLAIGGGLVFPTESREESYEALSKFVPSVKFDAENSREFLYRINRPVHSKILDEQLNRITTWSSVLMGRLPFIGGAQDAPKYHYAGLECDVSTDAARQELLPKNKLQSLLLEELDLAKENAAKGEIP